MHTLLIEKITMKRFFTFLGLYTAILLLSLKIHANQKIDDYINHLPKDLKCCLEHFAEDLFQLPEGSVGYVLYGNKPMCNVLIYEDLNTPEIFQESNQTLGYEFINKLNNNPSNKNYPIIEYKSNGYREIIFINRAAFIKVVNNNIHLFRYILGSTLTADSFLDQILQKEKGFYEAIKCNKLILGILLGYGTQNSLIVSREEDLSCELNDERIIFPFKDYETFIASQRSPSLGFNSLDDESKALLSLFQISSDLKPFDTFPIPFFGCVSASKETEKLLSMYESDRKIIVNLSKKGKFLSIFLERLCTTISGEIILPPNIESLFSNTTFENLKTQEKIIDCILGSILNNSKGTYIKKKSMIEMFLKGAIHQENGKKLRSLNWLDNWSYEYNPQSVFRWHVNSQKAKKLLQNISKQEGIIEIVPGNLYYKILIPGIGFGSTNKIKNVTYHYSLRKDDGTFVDSGTIKNSEIDKFLPGIALSLIGMKKDEEREIFMHPNYAYGWVLDSSSLLTRAQIKLLNFDEGDMECAFPQIHADIVNEKSFNKFKNEYKKIMASLYFSKGYYLWEKIKENNIKITIEQLSKHLESDQINSHFKNNEDRRNFIINYNCFLYSQNQNDQLDAQLNAS